MNSTKDCNYGRETAFINCKPVVGDPFADFQRAVEIKDSGERTRFESGAVRDLQAGKGRCDLLPITECIALLDIPEEFGDGLVYNDILKIIGDFMSTGEPHYLINAVYYFGVTEEIDIWSLVLKCAMQLERGAAKYGERNWEKGIPLERYIDSGIRHLLKYWRGDTDEPHDDAFIWNMLCGAWTARVYPELNKYPIKMAKD